MIAKQTYKIPSHRCARVTLLLAMLVLALNPALAETPEPPQDDAALANQAFTALSQAYLTNDPDAFEQHRQTLRRYTRHLDRQQKRDLSAMQRSIKDIRPDWWEKTQSVRPVSFKAEIWGRTFTANYKPQDTTGVQFLVPVYEHDRYGFPHLKDVAVVVSWRPGHVDSPAPASGKIGETHGYTNGDLAEVIVWHELGHNYISNNFNLRQKIELYTQHETLYHHLQEFYADATALAHTSPKARRAVLQMRLHGLGSYNRNGAHDRAAHAIGAIVLAQILENPQDWPSFHLPPSVPKQQVELNTIIYCYETMDPNWTYAEATALQDLIKDYIKKHGDKTFRTMGEVQLPDDQTMMLLSMADSRLQPERDQWMARKLQAAIDAGHADTLEQGETYDPPTRDISRMGNDQDPRLDLPTR